MKLQLLKNPDKGGTVPPKLAVTETLILAGTENMILAGTLPARPGHLENCEYSGNMSGSTQSSAGTLPPNKQARTIPEHKV